MTSARCSLSGRRSSAASARSAACAGARVADANSPCVASSLAMNSAKPLAWNASERGLASSRIDHVEHRQPFGRGEIARAVGDARIGELEQPVELVRAALVDRHLQRAAHRRAAARRAGRSTTKRQPMPRVMPSRTKPESVIIDVIARSSQTSVIGSAGSRCSAGSPIRRLSVRQWSTDIRSRRLKATRAEAAEPLRERALGMRRGAAQARAALRLFSTMPSCSARVHAGGAPTRVPHPRAPARSPRAAGARSRRSARRSGRTRTGSRRRARRASRRRRPGRRRSPSFDSSENSALTGPSASTQVSFERPPRCIAITRRVLVAGDARQAARHDAPAARRRDREDAQADGARGQAPKARCRAEVRAVSPMRALEHRRLRHVHPLLRDVVLRPLQDAPDAAASRSSAERLPTAIDGSLGERSIGLMMRRSGRCQASSNAAGLAQPPGGDRRQPQRLAEQLAAEARQVAEQRARLEHARSRARWRAARCRAARNRSGRRCRARNRSAARADRSSRRPGGARSRGRAAGRRSSSARRGRRAPSGRCPRRAGSRGSGRAARARSRSRCTAPA